MLLQASTFSLGKTGAYQVSISDTGKTGAYQVPISDTFYVLNRRARKLTGDGLQVVWAEFSSLS